ncbi:hypothetical protein HY78_24250 [Rhizorhabdus wittichii DC-6]|nr:hypothetical protein HY78_24250 [Rhizorhabdus wittichii DC-6]
MAFVPPVMPIAASAEPVAALAAQTAPAQGFGSLLTSGLAAADARVAKADALLAAFARGDSIPVHEVSLALEQARLSVEIAAEVRTRLLEVYRDFMTMQL